MTDVSELLPAHHLKTLRLPTFLREHDKQVRIRASEGGIMCAIWRYGEALTKAGAIKTLFERFDTHLKTNGGSYLGAT